MSELNSKLAYIVGDAYYELTRLSGVLTATQFFKGVINGSLPSGLTWRIGQGLSSAEVKLLYACKKYCSEIKFHNSEVIASNNNAQLILLEKQPTTSTIYSKLSRIIAIILQASKKSMHRLNSFNQ